MTAVTFFQTVDKNIFKSTSSLFVVKMIALSLLRRNPATHGVFLGSPSSFINKKTSCNQERKTSDCSSSFSVIELFD